MELKREKEKTWPYWVGGVIALALFVSIISYGISATNRENARQAAEAQDKIGSYCVTLMGSGIDSHRQTFDCAHFASSKTVWSLYNKNGILTHVIAANEPTWVIYARRYK